MIALNPSAIDHKMINRCMNARQAAAIHAFSLWELKGINGCEPTSLALRAGMIAIHDNANA